ncbi:MAG: nucleoid-associated protein, partial [Vallitalea sp.]|nr:nucleoid-associated protein [Vallitalea sp.]
DMSVNIANKLFAIMSSNVAIPSADLAVIHFKCKGVKYLALLKLNYGKSYIHHREQETNNNSIIQHRTTLPNMGQKINEAAIINLSTMAIQLLEKKYEIDGNKEYYLSQYLLKCSTDLSSKEQYNIVKNTTNSINKKYFDGDIERQIEIKQVINNIIEENGEINIEKLANQVYENNSEIKQEFIESVSKKGLEESTIKLSEKTIARSLEHHIIKTDTGIEIKVPLEAMDSIEFLVESDGKQTIAIKNNNKIFSK